MKKLSEEIGNNSLILKCMPDAGSFAEIHPIEMICCIIRRYERSVDCRSKICENADLFAEKDPLKIIYLLRKIFSNSSAA